MSRSFYDDENICLINGTDLRINYRHLAWHIISLQRNLGSYTISIHECTYLDMRRCQSMLGIAIIDIGITNDLFSTRTELGMYLK